MPKIILNLNPTDNTLEGLYTPGDDVLIMCDATDGDFAIGLPDAQSSEDTLFRFSKKDASLNVVQLLPKTGQKIMNEDSQELIGDGDLLILNSDGENWF